MTKTIRLILIALAVLGFGLLLGIAHSLASLGGIFYPELTPHFFIGLILIESICVFCLWRSVFGGNDHLHFPLDATAEEQKAFTGEMTARLRKNSHIIEAGFDPDAPDFLEKSLELLSEKADLETRRAAEKVFLATALAQNGKIDSLVVFVSLTRLVWRISKLYNQRPHPNEIVSLYWAVVSSAFLALSFEELDISTEITVGFGEIFHAVAPAAMTSGVPFVGAAVQKFTSCSIDGAANAYLALRTGIITRNAYRYSVSERKRPSRAAVYREAGGVLLGMASGLVEQVAKSLGGLMWEVTKKTPGKTVNLLKNGATSVGNGIAHSAGKVVESTSQLAKQTGTGLKMAGAAVGDTAQVTTAAVSQAAGGVAAITQKSVGGVVGAVERGAGAVALTVTAVGHTVGNTAASTARAIGSVSGKSAQTVHTGFVKTKDTVVHTADAAFTLVDKGFHKGKDAVQTGVATTQRTVASAVSSTVHTANAAVDQVVAGAEKTRSAVSGSARFVGKTLSRVKDGAEATGKRTTGILKRPFSRRKQPRPE